MTYPPKHSPSSAGGTATSSAETSTNSLEPYAPPSYQDPSPVRDVEKGPAEEDRSGDERSPDAVSQSSGTETFAARLERFSSTFLERLPRGVSHFLGYRRGEVKPVHPALVTFWAFVGVMGSLLLITLATENIAAFKENGSPVIVASFVCPPPSPRTTTRNPS